MKTRMGFVSNSSTTSFCIYGARTKVDEDNWQGRYLGKDLDDRLQELGIEMQYSQWSEEYLLGAEWSSIREDETGKEFRERIETEVLKIDPDATEFNTYEEAYRDG